MKRMTVLLLTAMLCLRLAACRPARRENPQEIQAEATDAEGSEEMQQSDGSTHREGTAEKLEKPVPQSIGLVGPWH